MTAQPSTFAEYNAIIDELNRERDAAKGAAKGQITKRIKALAIERDQRLVETGTAHDESVGEVVTDEQGVPESIATAAEPRPDDTPAASEPEPEPEVEPEVEPAQPHIVDSEKIDDVRYSITDDGRVWAPEGDTRCGRHIGHVLRDVNTKIWDAATVDGEVVKSDRSRKQTLIALVATVLQAA